MKDIGTGKISASHLEREACVYIRQSSPGQVVNNTESARRQYDLSERALALGWPRERIRVIDEDQGLSGADAERRGGFQDLMARIAAGEVGIVLSLEISRLGRNNADLHRLFRLAALSGTLVCDEAGVHDPGNSSDLLLLGIKSSVYEFELDGIRQRLLGGVLNKARRGELRTALPAGLVYDSAGAVVLDPDIQVAEAVNLVFETFRRTRSARATFNWLLDNAILLPACPASEGHRLIWSEAHYSRVLGILRNPRYAGCYAWGRRGGNAGRADPWEAWRVCIPEAHAGYIDWEEFQRNQRQLADNHRQCFVAAHGRTGPLREGGALLQSRAICGRCGSQMLVKYGGATDSKRANERHYYCVGGKVARAGESCQTMRGERIDAAVADFLVGAVNRSNIDLALSVEEQVRSDFARADRQRSHRVEALRHKAELAGRRYREVDPGYRLVAATLESEWNDALRKLDEAEAERSRLADEFQKTTDEVQRRRIRELSADFAVAWNAPTTGNADRKRMLALLVEDATLIRSGYSVAIQLRMRGGRALELDPVELLRPGVGVRNTPAETVAEVGRLTESMGDKAIAVELNRRGTLNCGDKPWTRQSIASLRHYHGLPSHLRRLQQAKREQGWSTAEEISKVLGTSVKAMRERSRRGTWVERHAFTIGTRTFSMYRLLDAARCERTKEPQSDHPGNRRGHESTREAS